MILLNNLKYFFKCNPCTQSFALQHKKKGLWVWRNLFFKKKKQKEIYKHLDENNTCSEKGYQGIAMAIKKIKTTYTSYVVWEFKKKTCTVSYSILSRGW